MHKLSQSDKNIILFLRQRIDSNLDCNLDKMQKPSPNIYQKIKSVIGLKSLPSALVQPQFIGAQHKKQEMRNRSHIWSHNKAETGSSIDALRDNQLKNENKFILQDLKLVLFTVQL